mgnify:CR=1 FL=1
MLATLPPADPQALRACRVFETDDLDEACDRISRIMQPHRLWLEGRRKIPHAHMDFLRLQGLGLGTIRFGQARIRVPPLSDYYLIIFCLSGSALLQPGREEILVDRRSGLLCAPGQTLQGEFSADCEQFVLRIEQARLAAFHGGAPPPLGARIDLGAARAQPLLSLLRTLATDPPTLQMIREDGQVAADYEHLLLRLLITAQGAGPGRPSPASGRPASGHPASVRPASGHPASGRPASVRPASLRRAIAYMEAEAGSPISLLDIAAAAGVPERTLHEAFQRFEGRSPLRYLRDLRLDRVRDRLLAEGEPGRVTAMATEAGFSHLGRFSRAYAERFGEYPSATRRAR